MNKEVKQGGRDIKEEHIPKQWREGGSHEQRTEAGREGYPRRIYSQTIEGGREGVTNKEVKRRGRE